MTHRRIVIAQISDTHIRAPGRLAYRKVDTAQYLKAAVALLAAPPVPIDAIIHTGDVTDFGTDEEYRHFCDLVAPLAVPLFPIPGNHDDRAAFRRAFARRIDLPADGPLSYAVDIGGLRMIMLDSSVPNHAHGELAPRTLAWLDNELAVAPARPVLIALHHPPFMTGIRHMDVQNCVNAAALEEVLRRHPQVLGAVCGHVHRTVLTTFAQRSAAIGPSPAHVVSLDLAPDGPPNFSLEPPAILLHVWDPASPSRLTTHWVPIGQFAGPHPFFDSSGRLID